MLFSVELSAVSFEIKEPIAIVTNSWGSAGLKVMTQEKKSGISLKVLCWHWDFEF